MSQEDKTPQVEAWRVIDVDRFLTDVANSLKTRMQYGAATYGNQFRGDPLDHIWEEMMDALFYAWVARQRAGYQSGEGFPAVIDPQVNDWIKVIEKSHPLYGMTIRVANAVGGSKLLDLYGGYVVSRDYVEVVPPPDFKYTYGSVTMRKEDYASKLLASGYSQVLYNPDGTLPLQVGVCVKVNEPSLHLGDLEYVVIGLDGTTVELYHYETGSGAKLDRLTPMTVTRVHNGGV